MHAVELEDLTRTVQDLETRIYNLTEREKATNEYVLQLEVKLAQADKLREQDVAAAANQRAKAAKLAKDLRNTEAYVGELEAKLAANEEQLRRLLVRSTGGSGGGRDAVSPAPRRQPVAPRPLARDVLHSARADSARAPDRGTGPSTCAEEQETPRTADRSPSPGADSEDSRDQRPGSAGEERRDHDATGARELWVAEAVVNEVRVLLGALETLSTQVEELAAENEELRELLQAAVDENAQLSQNMCRLDNLRKGLSSALEGTVSGSSFAEEVKRSNGVPLALECGASTAPSAGSTGSPSIDEASSPPAVQPELEPPKRTAEADLTMGMEKKIAPHEGEAESEREKHPAERGSPDGSDAHALNSAKYSTGQDVSINHERQGQLEACLSRLQEELSATKEAYDALLRDKLEEAERANHERQAQLEACVSRLQEELGATKEAYDALLRDKLKEAECANRERQAQLEACVSRLQEELDATKEAYDAQLCDKLKEAECANRERQAQLEACVSRLQEELDASKEACEALLCERLKEADEVANHERQAELEGRVVQLQGELSASKAACDALLRDRLKEAKVIHADWEKKVKALKEAQTKLEGALARERALKSDIEKLGRKAESLQSALDARTEENGRLSDQLDLATNEVNLLKTEINLHDSKAELAGLCQRGEAEASGEQLRAAKRQIAHLEKSAERMADELCELTERRHQDRERRRLAAQRRRSGGAQRGSRCPCREKERGAVAARIEELEAALRSEVERADAAGRRLEAADRERAWLLQCLSRADADRSPAAARRPWRAKAIWRWR